MNAGPLANCYIAKENLPVGYAYSDEENSEVFRDEAGMMPEICEGTMIRFEALGFAPSEVTVGGCLLHES